MVSLTKKSVRAEQTLRPDIIQKTLYYRRKIAKIPADKLIFLDESGCHANMDRSHTWGKKVERTVVHQSYGRSKNITVIGAIRSSGPVAMQSFESSLCRTKFSTFIKSVLAPRIKSGDVIVMDNLSVHKCKNIEKWLLRKGIKIIYTPPYSPHFNPIEMAWSVFKNHLRSRKNKIISYFRRAIVSAWRHLSQISLKAMIESCGYELS